MGSSPRMAQAAMRHSSLDLTMNVYTDPTLLDVAGAIEALPDLSLDGAQHAKAAKATGTDGREFPPAVSPNSCTYRRLS